MSFLAWILTLITLNISSLTAFWWMYITACTSKQQAEAKLCAERLRYEEELQQTRQHCAWQEASHQKELADLRAQHASNKLAWEQKAFALDAERSRERAEDDSMWRRKIANAEAKLVFLRADAARDRRALQELLEVRAPSGQIGAASTTTTNTSPSPSKAEEDLKDRLASMDAALAAERAMSSALQAQMVTEMANTTVAFRAEIELLAEREPGKFSDFDVFRLLKAYVCRLEVSVRDLWVENDELKVQVAMKGEVLESSFTAQNTADKENQDLREQLETVKDGSKMMQEQHARLKKQFDDQKARVEEPHRGETNLQQKLLAAEAQVQRARAEALLNVTIGFRKYIEEKRAGDVNNRALYTYDGLKTRLASYIAKQANSKEASYAHIILRMGRFFSNDVETFRKMKGLQLRHPRDPERINFKDASTLLRAYISRVEDDAERLSVERNRTGSRTSGR